MEKLTQDANHLLARLMKYQAEGDPIEVVHSLFNGEDDATSMTERMERALYERSCDSPAGIYVGSTAQLSVLGPPILDYPAAVKLLKLTSRILQVGRGRGKAIIIIDDTPLTDNELEGAVALSSPRVKFEPTLVLEQPAEVTEPTPPATRPVGPPAATTEPAEDFSIASTVNKDEMLTALDKIRQAAVENLSMIERMRDQIEST